MLAILLGASAGYERAPTGVRWHAKLAVRPVGSGHTIRFVRLGFIGSDLMMRPHTGPDSRTHL